MAAPTIRLASPDDAATLAGLRWDFRAGEAAPTEDRAGFLQRCTAWMESRLQAEGPWRAWLAEVDGATAGCLWLCLLEKLPNPRDEAEQHAYITSVYVAPEHRGARLGALLVEAAMACARDAGCDSAILWPTQRSRTLYERFGFAVRDDLMEAVVTPGRELGGAAEAR